MQPLFLTKNPNSLCDPALSGFYLFPSKRHGFYGFNNV